MAVQHVLRVRASVPSHTPACCAALCTVQRFPSVSPGLRVQHSTCTRAVHTRTSRTLRLPVLPGRAGVTAAQRFRPGPQEGVLLAGEVEGPRFEALPVPADERDACVRLGSRGASSGGGGGGHPGHEAGQLVGSFQAAVVAQGDGATAGAAGSPLQAGSSASAEARAIVADMFRAMPPLQQQQQQGVPGQALAMAAALPRRPTHNASADESAPPSVTSSRPAADQGARHGPPPCPPLSIPPSPELTAQQGDPPVQLGAFAAGGGGAASPARTAAQQGDDMQEGGKLGGGAPQLVVSVHSGGVGGGGRQRAAASMTPASPHSPAAIRRSAAALPGDASQSQPQSPLPGSKAGALDAELQQLAALRRAVKAEFESLGHGDVVAGLSSLTAVLSGELQQAQQQQAGSPGGSTRGEACSRRGSSGRSSRRSSQGSVGSGRRAGRGVPDAAGASMQDMVQVRAGTVGVLPRHSSTSV